MCSSCKTSPCAIVDEVDDNQANSCFTLTLMDSFGDGWNDAEYTWTEESSGTVVSLGTLDDWASGTAPLCGRGCYLLEVSNGEYPTEISWKVNDDAGVEQASGGAGDSATVCVEGAPSPQPSTSPGPTATGMPSLLPTTSEERKVWDFMQFKSAIGSNRTVHVMNDIPFTYAITIEGVTDLTIMSDFAGKAKLTGGSFDQNYGGILEIEGGSGVTLKGLSFEGGEAENGGCINVWLGSTVGIEDVDFKECVATVGLE